MDELAQCGELSPWLLQVAEYLDQYLTFENPDPQQRKAQWETALEQPLPHQGVGLQAMITELGQQVIANGSAIPRPGCTAFITTGATHAGVLAALAGLVASPQRIGLTAFHRLEELSLDWLQQLLRLHPRMKGVYSSGGSTANLLALGAARQYAFEQVGVDCGRQGVTRAARIFASAACHRTVQRAAGVLGLGRDSVVLVPVDECGRMQSEALRQLLADTHPELVKVAVVATAGTTGCGAIDPLAEIGQICRQHRLWFHVDGAYGLPGVLDPRVEACYQGIDDADSVIVDPHKWLGAPVGVGATFVRDRGLLQRAFTQEAADYLEGAFSDEQARHSMDSLGIPYSDFGIELSAPCRGVVVWALLREIGREGVQQRVMRHNSMARRLAHIARQHPNLELLLEPTLSICCFRYAHPQCEDLNELNRRIHRQLVFQGRDIPSTTLVNGQLAIRPCFIGARTVEQQADDLAAAVVQIGDQLIKETNC